MATDPDCAACGKPAGTGTLLDFQPNVPPAAVDICPLETWREFAARYQCPVCAAPDHSTLLEQ